MTKSVVRSASGSQTKLACDGGTVKPASRSAAVTLRAFGDDGVGAGQQFVGGVQRCDGGGLRDAGRGERHVDLAQRGDDVRIADGVARPAGPASP